MASCSPSGLHCTSSAQPGWLYEFPLSEGKRRPRTPHCCPGEKPTLCGFDPQRGGAVLALLSERATPRRAPRPSPSATPRRALPEPGIAGLHFSVAPRATGPAGSPARRPDCSTTTSSRPSERSSWATRSSSASGRLLLGRQASSSRSRHPSSCVSVCVPIPPRARAEPGRRRRRSGAAVPDPRRPRPRCPLGGPVQRILLSSRFSAPLLQVAGPGLWLRVVVGQRRHGPRPPEQRQRHRWPGLSPVLRLNTFFYFRARTG